MKKPKKYVLCPCFVGSKDGDVHYVTARRLAFLYNVPMDECYIDDAENNSWKHGRTREYLESLIWLFPDREGRYEI